VSVQPNHAEMRSKARDRTIGLLKGAHHFAGPQVKRIVLLSSVVAILNSFEDTSVAGADYSEKDWNPVNLRIIF
jgi:hypothetical protein